jgi:hypothetical protein
MPLPRNRNFAAPDVTASVDERALDKTCEALAEKNQNVAQKCRPSPISGCNWQKH